MTRSRTTRRGHVLEDVHFHQGPQGQPAPCYDDHCAQPRMGAAEIREAAGQASASSRG